MAETVSFVVLTRDALQNAFRARFVPWLALPIGALASGASYSVSKAEELLTGKEMETLLPFLSGNEGSYFFFLFGLSFILTLGQAPLRGLAVLILQSNHLKHSGQQNHSLLQKKGYWRSIRVATLFETGFWLLIGAIGLLLLVPSLLAWRFNNEVLVDISQLGFILFIGIALYLYFIKELSLFYGLLSNVSPRSSIDLGFRIFRRHSFLTLLYFTYLSILSLIVTLSIAITIHTLLILFKLEAINFLEYALSFPFLGLYFVFDQSMKLSYFRKIAASPKLKLPKVPVTKPAEPVTGMTNV